MANKFGIPEKVEQKIRRRDRRCVYCRKRMIYPCSGNNRRDWATIEHFRESGPFYWADGLNGLKEEDLAICCLSCNSSRGKKGLLIWFKSQYCIDRNRNINEQTVAKPVKEYIERMKK